MLPSPKARFTGNPHLSGKDGGRTFNLHQFAMDGMVLLGHLVGTQGETLQLAPDLQVNLAKADRFETGITKMVDGFIAKNGLEAPVESLPELRDGYAVAELPSLN
jgi:putative flavoprotein involved in K+ transport